MLSLTLVGAAINDQPDGVACAWAFDVSKNANPSSPDAAGTEP
jgi:hypothetical protein